MGKAFDSREFERPIGHAEMCELLGRMCAEYPFLSSTEIGKSLCGRSIEGITLGDRGAEKCVLYVGAHHASERITSNLLLRFIWDYCEAYRGMRRMYGVGMDQLFSRRRIIVIPMLNPDGVELQLRGAGADFPLRERVLKMNGGSEDFSKWKANGRGVDLNHNYGARFDEYKAVEAAQGIIPGGARYSGEYPESEPETAALCRLIRFETSIRCVLTLHTQGEVIHFGDDAAPVGARTAARTLARMSGYKLSQTEGTASYGGLTDWFVRELRRPSFTVECGRGENPLPDSALFPIYASLREAMFALPFLT